MIHNKCSKKISKYSLGFDSFMKIHYKNMMKTGSGAWIPALNNFSILKSIPLYTIHFISSIRDQSASWPGPWISKPIFRKLGPRIDRPWCEDPCLSRIVLHWSSIKYDSFYFFSQVSKQSSANLEFQGQRSENLVPGWTESGARIPDLLIYFLFIG